MMVFARMARRHWAKYLPHMTAALKKEGTFETETMEAAEAACRELAKMVSCRAQLEASKEIVNQEYILLLPETDDDL